MCDPFTKLHTRHTVANCTNDISTKHTQPHASTVQEWSTQIQTPCIVVIDCNSSVLSRCFVEYSQGAASKVFVLWNITLLIDQHRLIGNYPYLSDDCRAERRSRQVIVMRCRFAWVCMCIRSLHAQCNSTLVRSLHAIISCC